MTKKIFLSNSFSHTALVSDEDYKHVMKLQWYKTKDDGYAQSTRGLGTKPVYMHRYVAEHAFGEIPAGMIVDHINHNRLDNRRENLRIVSTAENNMNIGPRGGRKYKGVGPEPGKPGHWWARIKRNGKQVRIGTYGSPEDAARAYDARAEEWFPGVAYLNFPEEHGRTPETHVPKNR